MLPVAGYVYRNYPQQLSYAVYYSYSQKILRIEMYEVKQISV